MAEAKRRPRHHVAWWVPGSCRLARAPMGSAWAGYRGGVVEREKLRGPFLGHSLVLVEEEAARTGDAEDVRDVALALTVGKDEDDGAGKVAGLDDEGLGLGHDGLAEGGRSTGMAAFAALFGSPASSLLRGQS